MCDPATVDDIRARDFAGALALFTDDQLEILLDDATCYLGAEQWPDCACCYEKAKIFMAMHLGVIGAQGQAPGPMTSASAGGLSASWGTVGPTSGGLNSTRWGQQVEALAAGCGRTGPFVAASPATCC